MNNPQMGVPVEALPLFFSGKWLHQLKVPMMALFCHLFLLSVMEGMCEENCCGKRLLSVFMSVSVVGELGQDAF